MAKLGMLLKCLDKLGQILVFGWGRVGFFLFLGVLGLSDVRRFLVLRFDSLGGWNPEGLLPVA